MSSKRGFESDDDGHDEDRSLISSPPHARPVQKRSKGPKSKHQHQNAHIDPTWGQKYVFSSHANATTIPVGEESDFEDDADAMAYLMSVRHQAGEIPHLLIAPKAQIGPQLPPELDIAGDDDAPGGTGVVQEDDDYDYDRPYHSTHDKTKGYYDDGAYYDIDERLEEGEEVAETDFEKAMQEAYSAALLRSYLALRHIINTTPPRDAPKRLSSAHLTHAAPFGPGSHTTSTWTKVLVTLDPHPLQLALLSKDSVFLILRVLLGGQLLQRGRDIPERTSRWLWALLARLPEPGELTHWELGWVRDLGKRAVLLGRSLEEMAALREEVEEEGLCMTGDDKGDGRQAPADDGVPRSEASEGEDLESDQITAAEPLADVDAAGDDQAEDVAMELDSDSDGDASPQHSLEDIRKRLLAQLDSEDEEQAAVLEAQRRRETNMRVTINMILTVTGEFYGQRDLLEFREPFAVQ